MTAPLVDALFTATTSEACADAARTLAHHLLTQPHSEWIAIVEALTSSCRDKKSGYARESAALGWHALLEHCTNRTLAWLLCDQDHCLALLCLLDDKGAPVKEATAMALTALSKAMIDRPLFFKRLYLPVIQQLLSLSGGFWQTKVAALGLLGQVAEKCPIQVGEQLPILLPLVVDVMHDTKKAVAEAAHQCMLALAGVVGNPDLVPHVPAIVQSLAFPSQVPAVIERLSATTFVAEVTGPALALLVPLLVRALQERSSLALQRPTAILTDNLCRLVRQARDAAQFLPQLFPGIDSMFKEAAFPEIRQLANVARETLIKAGANSVDAVHDQMKSITLDDTKPHRALLTEADLPRPILEWVVQVCAELVRQQQMTESVWQMSLSTLLTDEQFSSLFQSAKKVQDAELEAERQRRRAMFANTFQGAEEICNCDFSLAYGGMMLLHQTNLTLHRGQRYGICAGNGKGKTTLLRAIAKGKLEGFPTSDVLRTVYVEHSLQGQDGSLPVIDFVAKDLNSTRDVVESSLRSVGFDDVKLHQPVGTLSGGWKMKLELARAILMKADVLLLDEPTNHLDVANVKWLEEYLTSQPRLTCMIVSHDSSFLDHVCTAIIHYEDKKLVLYPGNLSSFVEQRPEAKTYYTLSSSNVQFTFPPPGILPGVRSNTKAVLKMSQVSFTYPGANRRAVENVNAVISLSSRVGIVGNMAAGKSTIVKLLTGEIQPTTGTVWKHPNLRVAYVAQHAFHHLEQHLDDTPRHYLEWRYRDGHDRELDLKQTRQWTAEELAVMEKPIVIDGQARYVSALVGRQKHKKAYRYEIQWRDLHHKYNTWMPREELLERGFAKLIQAFDDRESARDGLGYRDLTHDAIRQHFENVGLPSDFAMHSKIGGLSGGQKVKVVLAAALWQCPHMLIMDEPTNYLDRDSLGGLAVAIRDWQGAVVMISHSEEFVAALCPEIWQVADGCVIQKGKRTVDDELFDEGSNASSTNLTGNDEAASGTGSTDNPSSIPDPAPRKKKKLTRNELKAQAVRRRQRHLKWLIEGGKKESDTDSD